MGAVYKNYKSGNMKNTIPGYGIIGYVIPVDWIDTFAQMLGNAAAGDRVTIRMTILYCLQIRQQLN
jgi:hypothetical protein